MTKLAFGATGRQTALSTMAAGQVDLLIIGGGITGCGIARDASLRGLSVALVEQDDFGSGTSGRSSKLIHGGLRYLAHGDFAMVRESARERYVLRNIAPHLVHPLPFALPVWPGQSMNKYRVGLWLLDMLAGAEEAECYSPLTPAQLMERAPGLRGPVVGGFLYHEYLTDDARITLENALSAAAHGALVANHARVAGLLQDAGGRIRGVAVEDLISGRTYEVRARVVVNATGPWAGEMLRTTRQAAQKMLVPSKGIHLMFRADRLPLTDAVVLTPPGSRGGFAIRRWDFVYIGTTDDVHYGGLDKVTADASAVADLLKVVQDAFPDLCLTEADILGTWAGLRPLIAQGKTARDTSRHDEVWQSPDGLITVAGGKLTTYRPMARRVMEHVARVLDRELPGAERTAEVPLPGRPCPPEQIGQFWTSTASALAARGVDAATARRLTWLYGAGVEELLAMEAEWLEPLAPGVPALRAEVRRAVEQEMALTLADVLDRRTALLLFSTDHGLSAAEPASHMMASLLDWDETERCRQVGAYQALAAAHGARGLSIS